MDGVIVADKPGGMTSHDVVNRVRRLAQTKSVGHLGTLDPLATGVLPLVIGKATRLARFFTLGGKTYEALVRFGYSTDTYDSEGDDTSARVSPAVTNADLEAALVQFRGTFLQTPPLVSAKKIAGVPAYKLARKKIDVTLAPVEVTVHALDLLEFESSSVRLRVYCGSGTYIRSIAHQLGATLGCGAHLEQLRRTASCGFEVAQAKTLEQLAELAAAGRLEEALIPAAQLLPEFSCEIVDDLTAGQIRHGRDFHTSPFRVRANTRYVKAISSTGELIAIGEARLPNLYHPMLVL